MKETIENNPLQTGRKRIGEIMGQLAAQKKKTGIAALLIIVMAFMWIRVLTSNTPDSASATVVGDAASRSEPRSKITYVELPVVQGRNDTLIRDFFTLGKGFLGQGAMVDVVGGEGSEELTKRIAEKLKLEAIVFGENPQAFINDELVSEGDKLQVKEGDTEYEFTVVKIGQSTVLMRCREAEVTLKLAPAIEGID